MANEPGAAVLTIFDQLIDRIKQMTPARSDNKPLGNVIYSQLLLGMPIWRDDYNRPWTPMGGTSVNDAVEKGELPAAPPAPSDGSTLPPLPIPDPRMQRAMQAAWKTSMLCRTMLELTSDGTYREFPTGRHLDVAYESILKGMQPGSEVEIAPDIKKRMDEAEKVLYEYDERDGTQIGRSRLYSTYLRNADALAMAKENFALANQEAMTDPIKANAWPVTAGRLNRAVDAARNALISDGAAKVEQALDILASVGVPMQAHMIARARGTYDNWNLAQSGVVPGEMPFSMILPTNWCDFEDNQGFEKLKVTSREYHRHMDTQTNSQSQQSWASHASRSSGGGAVSLGFITFGGRGSHSESGSSWQNSSESHFTSNMTNSAKNLEIELEYGLCTIVRPWLISDLFYLKDWYLAGNKKNSISDGTVDGQKDNHDKLMPMIPQQFLVVRNVRISTREWGSDKTVLENAYGRAQGSTEASASSGGGGAGVALGFINFGGYGSHSSSSASGQSSSWQARDTNSDFGSTFDGQTLEIRGTQIVGFLSDIVPAGPDRDDPTVSG